MTGARTATLRTPQQRTTEEAERMLHQLRLWEQPVLEPALREPTARAAQRLLRQIQQIVDALEGDTRP